MNDDFKTVRDTASESMIWRAVRTIAVRFAAAGEDAVATRVVSTRVVSPLQMWSVEERVRYGAAMLAIAGFVNVALVSAVNRYAAPGLPRAAVALAAVLSAIVAVSPKGFLAAWPSSVPGRLAGYFARLFHRTAE
jgi:hypothetical protein